MEIYVRKLFHIAQKQFFIEFETLLGCSGVRAGCVDLLSTVQQRVKPKYHVFGHIHEGYGITSDGKIIFINASTCDINYLPNNPPIVFDISLPKGVTKV